MQAIQVHNLSPETYWASQAAEARHGPSIDAEARSFLEEAVHPKARVKLGSIVVALAKHLLQ